LPLAGRLLWKLQETDGRGDINDSRCKGISNFKKILANSQFFYLKKLIFTYAKEFFMRKEPIFPNPQPPKKAPYSL